MDKLFESNIEDNEVVFQKKDVEYIVENIQKQAGESI